MYLQQLNNIENAQTFDFEAEKNIELTLDTLKRTHKENDIFGRPLKGFYHYEAIERIADAAESRGLMPIVSDLWAAQNASKSAPGVVLLPQVEAVTMPHAVEAHILRRVFCTLNLMKYDDGEKCTNIALTFHQDGVQVAIGQRVTICRNQTILGAEHTAISKGNDQGSINELFGTVERWLDNAATITDNDRQRIERLKAQRLDRPTALMYLGLLNCMRVAADSRTKAIRDRVKVAPLNQAQLSIFAEHLTERLMLSDSLTAWEFLNLATEVHKPTTADMPRIIPTNAALFDMMAAVETERQPLLNC
ncbi:MAG: DUF932 domain-containing protein [Bacteroidales bacterium]|nr:DUF932 domain-containing protein [Bacteroidales bacterium]